MAHSQQVDGLAASWVAILLFCRALTGVHFNTLFNISLLIINSTMTTSLYGYLPTLWVAVSWCVGCILTYSHLKPLFKRNGNTGLGVIIVAGIVFQFIAHTSMAVSSQLPESIPPWIVQRLAFALAKFAGRMTVVYTYRQFFLRITSIHAGRVYFLLSIGFIWLCGFLTRFAGISLEIANSFALVMAPEDVTTLMIVSSALLLSATLGFCALFIWVVVETRKQVPWYKFTWMLGYYISLHLATIILLIQDIYILVTPLASSRTEMVELALDMGMTKVLLILLGVFAYEVAQNNTQSSFAAKLVGRLTDSLKECRECNRIPQMNERDSSNNGAV
jgi:hypothetical protein